MKNQKIKIILGARNAYKTYALKVQGFKLITRKDLRRKNREN